MMYTQLPTCSKASVAQGCKIKRSMSVTCSATPSNNPQNAITRKHALASIAALIGSVPSLNAIALAEDMPISENIEQTPAAPASSVEFKQFADPTLAYSFNYPATLANGKPLSLILTRKPERYSSAAPLTADARQRIVSELADLINAVTVSVSVGPPSPLLKALGKGPEEWKPASVAEQVLIDRSTARVTSGQRVSLNSVESVTSNTKNGTRYIIYEHVSKGSPTTVASTRETYRHAMAVTAARPGLDGTPYLFTLNVSCPEELWPQLESSFRQSVESFQFTEPTSEYVAPDQDPWRFF